jgi:predicted membrane protein
MRVFLISAGCVAILLPAWLPDRSAAQLGRGTVEILQALLLAAAAAVMLGASAHAGPNRPVCRVLALGCLAAFIGEIDDFMTDVMKQGFIGEWLVALVLLVAAITIFRHRRVMLHFFSTLGNHAGSGFIGAALLILYVFNHIIGSSKFWKATLGPEAFSPEVARVCRTYLELLACYLIFVGALGLSITLARRKELF